MGIGKTLAQNAGSDIEGGESSGGICVGHVYSHCVRALRLPALPVRGRRCTGQAGCSHGAIQTRVKRVRPPGSHACTFPIEKLHGGRGVS